MYIHVYKRLRDCLITKHCICTIVGTFGQSLGSTLGNAHDFRIEGSLIQSLARPISFNRHWDINSSPSGYHCFNNANVGKAASDVERIFRGIEVKDSVGNHG